MTLKKLRVRSLTQGAFCQERRLSRTLLRRASRGNVHAYTQAISPYSNLINEYLYLSGFEDRAERLFEVKCVLRDCWRYLPYTRRVSDFERFLQVRLERAQSNRNPNFKGEHTVLNRLSHQGRFLLVARFFNNWSLKSLKLSLRTSKKEIEEALLMLRCSLVDVETDKLTWVEFAQISRVNALLEGGFSDKACRKVEKEVRAQYHALQFKTDWLTYRCELADLRTEVLMSSEEIGSMASDLTELIRQQPMEKPRLYDSLVNQISFVRLPVLSE